MTCREFARRVEGFALAELGRTDDAELLGHQRSCTACAALVRQRHHLAGAIQVLRSTTAALQAPSSVEHEVLRAFRQSSWAMTASATKALPDPFAVRLSRIFEWGAYAAAAAALAISIGLGMWFWQHSAKMPTNSAQQPRANGAQRTESKVVDPRSVAQRDLAKTPKVLQSVGHGSVPAAAVVAATLPAGSAESKSLVQAAQAQGYTPLMLCDPLSCSDDEQVVRLELPANAADGSTESQMADVVVGDDGLVRAIRIVQR